MPQQKAAPIPKDKRQSAKSCNSIVQDYHNNSKKSNKGLTHISEILEGYKAFIPEKGER